MEALKEYLNLTDAGGTLDHLDYNGERVWERSAKAVGRAVGTLTFAGNRNLPIPSAKFYGASEQYMGSSAVYEISGYTHKVAQLIAAYSTPTDRGLTTQLDTTTGVSTINGTSTDTFANVSENLPETAKSHKVYIQMQIVKNENSIPLQFGALDQGLYTPAAATGTLGAVGTIDPARALSTGIRNFPAGSVFNDVRVVLQIFDLTEDFGAGKEPSSVSACQDYYGDGYYPKGTHLVSAKSPISIGSTQLTFTGELTKWDKIRSNGRRTTKGATLVLPIAGMQMSTLYADLDYAIVLPPGCASLSRQTLSFRNWESTYPYGSETYNDAGNIGKIIRGVTIRSLFIGFPKGTTVKQANAAMAGQVIAYELATETVTDVSPVSCAVGQPVTDARGVPLTATTEEGGFTPSPELPSAIKINNAKWTLNGETVDLSLISGGGLFGDGGLADDADTSTGIGHRAFGKIVLSDIDDWSVYSGCYISSSLASSVKHLPNENVPAPGKCTALPVVSATAAYGGTIGIAVDMERDIAVNVGTATLTVPELQALLDGAVFYYPLETPSQFALYEQPLDEVVGNNTISQVAGDIPNTEADITFYAYPGA